MRRRYEISDEEWNVIEPFLPPYPKPHGGRPPKDRCQMLNAVLWIARIGAPWRDLPAYYGSWSSAYSFSGAYKRRGMGHHFGSCFVEPDWSQVMIDTTVVRVHQHGSAQKVAN